MTISPLYHNARPEGQLLPQEAAAYDLLEQLGIDYDRICPNKNGKAALSSRLCLP